MLQPFTPKKPVPLPNDIHEQIFQVIRNSFAHRLPKFDAIVGSKLRQLLEDSNSFVINEEMAKNAVTRYYDINSYKSDDEKSVLWMIKLIFRATLVLIISCYDYKRALIWPTVDKFYEVYGCFQEFRNLDGKELQFLLNFRNVIVIAQQIIPPKNNKGSLILIAGSLEGSKNEYVTGGGQKNEVTRRVIIYETEGQIRARVRPPRVNVGEHSEPNKQVKNCSTSRLKQVKELSTEKLERIVQHSTALSKLDPSDLKVDFGNQFLNNPSHPNNFHLLNIPFDNGLAKNAFYHPASSKSVNDQPIPMQSTQYPELKNNLDPMLYNSFLSTNSPQFFNFSYSQHNGPTKLNSLQGIPLLQPMLLNSYIKNDAISISNRFMNNSGVRNIDSDSSSISNYRKLDTQETSLNSTDFSHPSKHRVDCMNSSSSFPKRQKTVALRS